MKKLYIIAILILSFAQFADAQEKRREEIESFRIAYFTRQLELSSEDAKKFWPVYNEMQIEMQKIHKERKARNQAARENKDDLSDAEIEKLINEQFALRQKELDIEKKYHDKFKSVLTMKQLARYYRAQEGFKRELLRKLQDSPRERDGN